MSIRLLGDASNAIDVSLVKLYFKKVHQPHEQDKVCLDIGRDSCCDIRIQYDGNDSKLYKLISKKHAELMLSAEGVFVRDGDSKNGTFINNTRIEGGWFSLSESDYISLGCPCTSDDGENSWHNPYALSVGNIKTLRQAVYEFHHRTRSWDDLRKSFHAISQQREGSYTGARSPRIQSPVKKKSKEIDVIDLTETHTNVPKAPLSNKQAEKGCQNVYNPSISYYLQNEAYILMPVGPHGKMKHKHIRRVPGEFLSDPQHGSRRLNMFDVMMKGSHAATLHFRPRVSEQDKVGFAGEFSNWFVRAYCPKAYKALRNMALHAPEDLTCFCGNSNIYSKHFALPGYRLGCNHVVCASCLLESCSSRHAMSPCCNKSIRTMPTTCDTNHTIKMMLEDRSMVTQYSMIFGEPRRMDEKLKRLLQQTVGRNQTSPAMHPSRRTLTPTTQRGNNYDTKNDHANASEAYITHVQPSVLQKSSFVVSEKPSLGAGCAKCKQQFSPQEDSTLAFGIQQKNQCHWYHMTCVDPDIRFRALTEGIEGYSTMDNARKAQVIEGILSTR